MPLFFRWIKRTSPDLAAAKNGRLVYSDNGKPSRKACWIFEEGAAYQAGPSIRKERLLVAFELGSMGNGVIKNPENHIDFEDSEFKGEAAHPYQVIVKKNEQGAYGVGGAVLGHLQIEWSRLATRKEVAAALGLKKIEVEEQAWPKELR